MTCIHPDLRAVYNNLPENNMVLNAETAVLVRQSIVMPEMADLGDDPDLVITRLSIPGPAGDIAQFMVQPKPEEGKLYPVVLDIHGGGMFYGTAEDAASLMAEAAKKLGYLYISPEYRLAPEHPYPAALEDCYATLLWIHDHIKEYHGDPEKIIIGDFSADVKAGQKIAIVGPTGAGKTTMVKLLMRFYDVNSGTITLDGTDIRRIPRKKLRESFGMVLQDTWLFNGTIMENIRYGRLDATDEEVIAAAKAAHAHHFIKSLPNGYDMVLNEDASNVSQGQKQLLTIARAILSDSKVMILDEATSSVDTRTEVLIQDAMDRLMSGRTSFVIAHRLSTIRNADLILVMKDGDIVEQGDHQELLDKNGFYAQLYNSQFESA